MGPNFFDTVRILVTGGAGFLGSHLCERLLAQGHYVICLDNYFTGQKRNILHLTGHTSLEVIRHDLVNPIFLEVDQIYNLACPASPVHYQYNPVKTTKTAVMGAIHMLGLAKRVKARILQASTSEVYGDPSVHPQKESYWGNVSTTGLRACYDEGKRCAETLFFDYYRQNKVNIRVVRIFNTYGPRMHPNDGRVISNFIMQALRNEPITIFGDGLQTRSFCYVDDMVEGIIRMMNGPDDFVGPVNLGNPGEYSMLELAQTILRLTGSKSRLEFQPSPMDDPKRRQPDISLAKEKLGWEPVVKAAGRAGKDHCLLQGDPWPRMKRIAILGSTGSIGCSSLKVIEAHPEAYQVTALAAGKNMALLAEQIRKFKPLEVAVLGDREAESLRERLDGGEKNEDCFRQRRFHPSRHP